MAGTDVDGSYDGGKLRNREKSQRWIPTDVNIESNMGQLQQRERLHCRVVLDRERRLHELQ